MRKGDPKNCFAGGGGGGVAWAPGEGGGFQKWASVPGPLFCVRTDVAAPEHNFWSGKVFFTKKFSPHMCSQNDQRDVGIILRHVCWSRPPPPPARQVGQPQPKTPLPAGRPRSEGGGMGFHATRPPRKAIFFPPSCWPQGPCTGAHAACHLVGDGDRQSHDAQCMGHKGDPGVGNHPKFIWLLWEV